jgi:hypothetical protein
LKPPINSVYDQLNAGLLAKSRLLIAANPSISRYGALGKFIRESFKPDCYAIAENDETVPALEKSTIAAKYNKLATGRLELDTTPVGRVPLHEYLVNEIAWIQLGTERKLAIIQVDYFCDYGNCTPHDLKMWIPKEWQTLAIERWKADPLSKGTIRTFDSKDVTFADDLAGTLATR